MTHSTSQPPTPAIPLSAEQLAALLPLLPLLGQLAQRLLDFQTQPVTPQASHHLETDLLALTRQIGRAALETTLNSLEGDQPQQAPAEMALGGLRYRRRGKSPHTVDSTFGPLRLRRWLYEPRTAGERCLFPLDLRLGLVAGRATPALADRVGRLLARDGQRDVLRSLAEDHDLHWSAATLRKVSACVAAAVGEHRQQAQAEQVIDWLRLASRSRGSRQVVLAVGRDGICVPMRQDDFREASVATVAVYDRHGRRLGTVYLGWMPQEQQQELSRQLTSLVQAILAGWKGRRPRLVYLTDGGWHPEEYYRQVLRKMTDPRTGERLSWQRVLDYYHAAKYVTDLSEAIFGQGKRAQRWAARMRGVLKQEGGLGRLLQSASYHRNQQRLRGKRLEAFWKAYGYLWRRRQYAAYARYRREGLPIGSGVTEAGCKVLLSQRLKRSGMAWKHQGGQVVLTLRAVYLSGVWARAWNIHLADTTNMVLHSFNRLLAYRAVGAA